MDLLLFKKISNKINRFHLLPLGLLIIYAIHYFNREDLVLLSKTTKENNIFIKKSITNFGIIF